MRHWSGFPCLPPGDLPNKGIKLTSRMSLSSAGRFFNTSATSEARHHVWLPTSHFLEKGLDDFLKFDTRHLNLLWVSVLHILCHCGEHIASKHPKLYLK